MPKPSPPAYVKPPCFFTAKLLCFPCQPQDLCSVVSDFLAMQQVLTKQSPYVPFRAVFIYFHSSYWLGKRFILLVETNKNVSSGIQVLDSDIWGVVWERQLLGTWRCLGLLESYSPLWDWDEGYKRPSQKSRSHSSCWFGIQETWN